MVLKLFIPLGLAILVSTLYQEPLTASNFTISATLCPLNGTFLPDHTNCSRYKVCIEDRIYNFSCAANLFFDHRTNNCDYGYNINLLDGVCKHSTFLYFRPHICDCNKYVFCDYGTPKEENCPFEQDFNLATGNINDIVSFPDDPIGICGCYK